MDAADAVDAVDVVASEAVVEVPEAEELSSHKSSDVPWDLVKIPFQELVGLRCGRRRMDRMPMI